MFLTIHSHSFWSTRAYQSGDWRKAAWLMVHGPRNRKNVTHQIVYFRSSSNAMKTVSFFFLAWDNYWRNIANIFFWFFKFLTFLCWWFKSSCSLLFIKTAFSAPVSVHGTIGLQIVYCLCFICISMRIETRCFEYGISASCCRKKRTQKIHWIVNCAIHSRGVSI